MNKVYALLASAAIVLAASAGWAAKGDHHIKASLDQVGGSGVTGTVHITQLPHGANLVVHAEGLRPGETYTSFYYESADCSAEADPLKTFTAGSNGRATVQGHIDEDLDEVGSVSVRLGPSYGDLLACARIH